MADVRDDIVKYRNGELSPAEMHALEKKALSDPLLADALDGSSAISAGEFAEDIGRLKEQLKNRTAKNNGGGFVIWNWPLRIAAAVILLAVSTFIVLNIVEKEDVKNGSLAINQEKEPVVEPQSNVSHDSIETEKSVTEETKPAEQIQLQREQPKHGKTSTTPPVDHVNGAQVANDQPSDSKPQEPPLTIAKADESPEQTVIEDKGTLNDAELAESVSGAPQQLDSISGYSQKNPSTAPAVAKKQDEILPLKTIRGKVTDADDGIPLPGVNVLAKGSSTGTTTDLNGNYEITLADDNDGVLVFSYIGMEAKEVPVPETDKQAEEKVDVQMTPDVSELSEVVVTGYSAEDDDKEFNGTKWELAEPEGGRKKYNEYLEKNLLYPRIAIENKVEGKVTVQFTVQPTGQLTDFRVVKSLGYGCDEEVIRLIKEGPSWTPTKKDDEPVKGKAKVKMRFSLNNTDKK